MMSMKNFTINDLERFSGIKAHTLRVWERRYALVKPIRSPGNFRLYTLDELKKILNIALLKKNGYRISVLSKIKARDIEDKIEQLSSDNIKWQKAINDLTINMYTLQPESFEWVLDELLLHWPIDILVEKIIFPFLNLTHLLWTGNKLSEEHLVVTAIRKKLIFAIESAGLISTRNEPVLLFLPDRKQLDLGLLYCNYYLKRRGIKILYLGNDVTIQNLKSIFHELTLSYLFTYLPQNHLFDTAQLLQYMKLYAPGCKLLIGKYCSEPIDYIHDENLMYMDFANALKFLHKSIPVVSAV